MNNSPTPSPSPAGRGAVCNANCRRLWRPRHNLSKQRLIFCNEQMHVANRLFAQATARTP